MKKYICLLILTSFLSCKMDKKAPVMDAADTELDDTIPANIEEETPEESKINWKHVCAENGLNVRNEAGVIIGKLMNAQRIRVDSYTEEVISVKDGDQTIQGRKAIFDFYTKNGPNKKGYVFEGYLCEATDVKIYESELCLVDSYYNEGVTQRQCERENLFELELISKDNYEAATSITSNDFIVNKGAYKKVGELLTLPTDGEDLKIEGFIGEDKSAIFTYEGEIPALNSYVVSGRYYEDWDTVLYDKSSGKEVVKIMDVPYGAPNGKYMVAFDINSYEGTASMEFFTLEKGRISKEHRVYFKRWAPMVKPNIKWVSNNALVLKVSHLESFWSFEEQEYLDFQFMKITFK